MVDVASGMGLPSRSQIILVLVRKPPDHVPALPVRKLPTVGVPLIVGRVTLLIASPEVTDTGWLVETPSRYPAFFPVARTVMDFPKSAVVSV